MTFVNITALFSIMFIGALIPSVSSITVVTRSATFGFIHGAFVSAGIVLGDIIFILIAIFGLSVLVNTIGDLFIIVKYSGGAYLIFLGIILWRSKPHVREIAGVAESSLLSSFLAGLIITLGDQKAILFYLGFFPTLFDLSKISYFDISSILLVTIVAVGGVKCGYAYMAGRTSLIIKNTKAINRLNLVAATVLISVGIVIIVKA